MIYHLFSSFFLKFSDLLRWRSRSRRIGKKLLDKCKHCQARFKGRQSLQQHLKFSCPVAAYAPLLLCNFCSYSTRRRDNMAIHIKRCHSIDIVAANRRTLWTTHYVHYSLSFSILCFIWVLLRFFYLTWCKHYFNQSKCDSKIRMNHRGQLLID